MGSSDDETNARLLAAVKSAGIARRDILTDTEFRDLAETVLQKVRA